MRSSTARRSAAHARTAYPMTRMVVVIVGEMDQHARPAAVVAPVRYAPRRRCRGDGCRLRAEYDGRRPWVALLRAKPRRSLRGRGAAPPIRALVRAPGLARAGPRLRRRRGAGAR